MECGFNVIRMLKDILVRVQDPQVPEPGEMAFERRGVEDGGSFLNPARGAGGGDCGVRGPIIRWMEKVCSVNANATFASTSDPGH